MRYRICTSLVFTKDSHLKREYDAIVIGLGAMGSAAAYQLTKRGAKVLGLDRYAPPHRFGSTHGETRITRIACGEGLEYTPLAVRSNELWRQIERETGASLITQNGFASIAGKKRAAKAGNAEFLEVTIAAAKAAGIEYEILDGKNFRRRFPAFNVKDGDAVYFDRVGGFLRPEICVETQLRLAREKGAELRLNERALSFEETGGAVSVKTAAGEYSAQTLIISAGPWLPELIDAKLMPGLKVTRQIVCWFRVKDTARFEDFQPARFPVFVWQVPAAQISYGFPALGGPADGVKISTEQYDVAVDPENMERTVSPTESRALYEEYVEHYFPGLSAECVRSDVCLYTSVPGSRFVIDRHPAHRRTIVVSPCSGHGFKHSAAIGEAAAQMALGEPHLDLSEFRFRT
ncbi:MAG: N-methyl-L-tryptophan oxidase [Xanthobacteraceae bacterium]|nr:N-methyl-L-tryptophan oxidase [Xanthobacteraceae bacterium]